MSSRLIPESRGWMKKPSRVARPERMPWFKRAGSGSGKDDSPEARVYRRCGRSLHEKHNRNGCTGRPSGTDYARQEASPQPTWTCQVCACGRPFPASRVQAAHAFVLCACEPVAGAESVRTSDCSGMSRIAVARLSRRVPGPGSLTPVSTKSAPFSENRRRSP